MNITENLNLSPAWAEINTANLSYNLNSIKQFLGHGSEIVAVVKANAYGLGVDICAPALANSGVRWFAVANAQEAVELRQLNITGNILVFGSCRAGEADLFAKYNLIPVIFTPEQVKRLDEFSRSRGINLEVHAEIETGMNRVGIPFNEVTAFSKFLIESKGIVVKGIMSHYAAADSSDETAFTKNQLEKLLKARDIFLSDGHPIEYLHIENSPGAITHHSNLTNLSRIGGLLYGFRKDVLPINVDEPQTVEVLSLKTRIELIKNISAGETVGYSRTFTSTKDMRIATIPIGYNDGLDRGLSNNWYVLVKGKKSPIVGRISMDWTTLDLSNIPEAKEGDEVVIIGEQGNEKIYIEDMARAVNTISYEISCRLGKRVIRYRVA
jgi:alanine racemase